METTTIDALLAEGLKPVENPPIRVRGEMIPAAPESTMPYALVGTIPQEFQLDADFAKQRYSDRVPTYRLFPFQNSAQPSQNSTVVSGTAVLTKQVANVPNSNTQIVSVGTSGNMQKSSLGNAPKGALPVAPITQNNLPDGTSRFARTSVHSSHAPTTNPLTGHDAGSNVTINVAAHTMQVGATAVSNNSGSVTALSYLTLYYIYYDDPTLAGGAVSYQATTTKTTAINGAGRFFVGSVLTPAATAPDTKGNGDGGTGSQVGSLYQLFFDSSVPTTTAPGSVTNPGNAIDGNFTTQATLNDSPNGSCSLLISGAPGFRSGRATSFVLNVLSQVSVLGTGYTLILSYSTNAGGSFTNIYSVSVSRTLTTDSISLPVTVNPGAVQVKASITAASATNSANIHLYEAWITIQE